MDAVATATPAPKNGRLARTFRAYGQELRRPRIAAGGHGPLGSGERALPQRNNLNSIFSEMPTSPVAAIGMSMVIIAGHIDVSVGRSSGARHHLGQLAVRGYPIWVAWLASIVAGIAIQAVNGVLVAYARIPAIVVTWACSRS